LANGWQAIYFPGQFNAEGRATVTSSRDVAASFVPLIAAGLIALAPQSADAQAIAVASGAKGKVHLLPATLETTQWGWFNNAQPPVLRIDSGIPSFWKR
jgi:outer membrane protein W